MNRSRYLLSFTGAFIFGFFALSIYNNANIGANMPGLFSGNYYIDSNGNSWNSYEEYQKHLEDIYFIAPDGTLWESEFRYNNSLD